MKSETATGLVAVFLSIACCSATLSGPPPLPDGTIVRVEPVNGAASEPTLPATGLRKRTSLADWAEQNAGDWDQRLNSEDVEGFTGRRF